MLRFRRRDRLSDQQTAVRSLWRERDDRMRRSAPTAKKIAGKLRPSALSRQSGAKINCHASSYNILKRP
jgi:hypothetical protein